MDSRENKRTHSESKSSFLKSMKSLISKVFSPKSSSNNIASQPADTNDSSTDEDGPDIIQRPPAKRICMSPSKCSYVPTTTSSSTNTDAIEYPLTPMEVLQNRQKDFKWFPKYVSSPYVVIRREDDNFNDTEPEMSLTLKSPLSQIDSPGVRPKEIPLGFNNSKSYCSDAASVEGHCSRKQHLGSPFYTGNTTYGGAASSRVPNTYKSQNHRGISKRRNRILNLSASSRQILDILDDYSSPVKESKRISQSIQEYNPETNAKPNPSSYKTQHLQVPSLATTLNIKRNHRLSTTANVAQKLVASHSSSKKAQPYDTSSRRSALPPTVDLPAAVLEIEEDNLPTILITAPSNSDTAFDTTHTVSERVDERTCEHVERPDALLPKSNTPEIAAQEQTVPKCDTCPVENGIGRDKCEGCLSKNPALNSKNKKAEEAPLSNKTFEDIIKEQKQKWTCTGCYTLNEISEPKCVCCQNAKPGSNNDPAPSTAAMESSAPTPFKFGIPLSSAGKETEVSSESKETNNNVLPKSTFSFGIPVTKNDNTLSNIVTTSSSVIPVSASDPKALEKPADVSQGGQDQATFCISNEDENKTTISTPKEDQCNNTFALLKEPLSELSKTADKTFTVPRDTQENVTFCIPREDLNKTRVIVSKDNQMNMSLTSVKDQCWEENATTVPKTQDVPSTSSSLFNKSSLPSASVSSTMSTSFSKTFTFNATQSILSLPIASPSVTTSENTSTTASTTSVRQPLFGIGASNTNNIFKPSSLFGNNGLPTNNAVTSSSTVFGNFQPTTSVASVPLFQNNSSSFVPSTSSSLFAQTDVAVSVQSAFQNTITTAQSTITRPMFSFGSAPQSNAGQEKSPFAFTFGSNNIRSSNAQSNVFSVPNNNPLIFGARPENSSNTLLANQNRPSLQVGNNSATTGLMSGNGMTGSSFSTPAQILPTENTLAGSGMTESSFSSPAQTLPMENTLPGSGMSLPSTQQSSQWPINNSGTNLFATTTSQPVNQCFSPTFSFGSQIEQFGSNNTSIITNTNNNTQYFSSSQNPLFGNPQPNSTPSIGMFNQSSDRSFGASNQPQSTPVFNFSSGQNSPAPAFDFSNQQHQAGAYAFGGISPGPVQFRVGSAPNAATTGRRMRKAVRRTTPR